MHSTGTRFAVRRIFPVVCLPGKLFRLSTLITLLPGLATAQTELTHYRPSPKTTALQTIPYGIISTVAGTGVYGYGGIGGLATGADLASPAGLAVDHAGNIYIADPIDDEVLKVSAATGDISVFAGTLESGYAGDNGPATSALLNTPNGLACDGAGNLYIADTNNSVIRKVNSTTGVITTVAGSNALGAGFSGDGAPATGAQLNLPYGIAIDSAGDLFISDSYNGRIREVNASSGIIATVAGGGSTIFGDQGLASQAFLSLPQGIAVDANGNLFIADSLNSLVRRVDAITGTITTVAGSYACNGFCFPMAGYSGDGGPATAAELSYPIGVAVDAPGNLYIGDAYDSAIRRVDSATGFITTVVGNPLNNHLTEFPQVGYTGDGGPASSAEISYPEFLTLDNLGNLLFGDNGDLVVRRVTLPTTTAAAAPVFSIPGGVYNSGQTVALSSPTAGATIYYSTSGIPNTSSTPYSAPIPLTQNAKITAFATAPSLANSLAEGGNFVLMSPPTISPAPGAYNAPLTVTISNNLGGPSYLISYTTDGTTPIGAGNDQPGPFTFVLTQSATVQAANVITSSLTDVTSLGPIAAATFTITPQTAPPTFSIEPGSYTTAQSVKLNDATGGATIYYTTNGATPTTTNSSIYSGVAIPITVSSPVGIPTIIKAFAKAPGFNSSPIVSGAFKVQAEPVPTTLNATNIAATSATFNAAITTYYALTDYYWAYGTSSTKLNLLTPIHNVAPGTYGVTVSAPILDLLPKTEYFYRIVATNSSGTVTGAIRSLTTP